MVGGLGLGPEVMARRRSTDRRAPGAVPDTPHAAAVEPFPQPGKEVLLVMALHGADKAQRGEASPPGSTGPSASCWESRVWNPGA